MSQSLPNSALSDAPPTLPALLRACLDRAASTAFLIDFDGTLVHFAPHPDKVIVPASLVTHLRQLASRTDLAFAIVTGRPIHRLDLLLGGAQPTIVGSHGGEWRQHPGGPTAHLGQPMSLLLRRELERVADRHRCVFEDKHYTVSLHLPFEQAHKDLFAELKLALGEAHPHFTLRKIGRTYEILQDTLNKGSGIRHLMTSPAFRGKTPLYIGDDTTTDDSLRAVTSLGGHLVEADNTPLPQRPNQHAIDIDTVRLLVEHLAELPPIASSH